MILHSFVAGPSMYDPSTGCRLQYRKAKKKKPDEGMGTILGCKVTGAGA